jgi:hypothetical protein
MQRNGFFAVATCGSPERKHHVELQLTRAVGQDEREPRPKPQRGAMENPVETDLSKIWDY